MVVQGLDKSSLPRNTRMVALGNRANFEFRAFQVYTSRRSLTVYV